MSTESSLLQGNQSKNELYRSASSNKDKPWWKTTFFVREPILFGTWDGVYTSCLLNIFGVVIFLRAGWVVGNAGLGLTLLMVFLSLLPVYISVSSAIGICERSQLREGGVYSLISHVLGQRTGTAVGLVYCIGQACSCSLYVSGIAESISNLAHIENPWAERGLGCGFLSLLLGISPLSLA
ncbi:hypothetical protein Ciccas_004706 [Cichlidogyrus casuarinus]|uniref:Amino acid permease/ SLC12A domain-containing protein n=1 Tax=Cichlidogyrus casuarinus TaxID=1844966 RepID=A0ABD2QAV4_9PLAT